MTQLTLDQLWTPPDAADDLAALLEAAAAGPPAWRRGLNEHLATYPTRTHGRTCPTCWAIALAYRPQIDWPLEEHTETRP
ncbi:hypothetical protein [Nonomuraea bangladeshensis]|uniref:hypothetical protein n=1 Tax=Nonomuraea bangladeshensis TaxID=404385 RepID=UPI0031D7B366